MLEKVELVKNEKDTYEVTYVVGTTDEEGSKTTVRRVTFNVKKNHQLLRVGWLHLNRQQQHLQRQHLLLLKLQLKTRRDNLWVQKQQLRLNKGRSGQPYPDMISQSKDWPNKLVPKVGEVTKIRSYYWHPFMQWDQYLQSNLTGVFIAFGFIPR